MSSALNFQNCVRAGYPGIVMNTPEAKRALATCKKVASDEGMSLATWTPTKGFSFFRNPATASASNSNSGRGIPQISLALGIKGNSKSNHSNIPDSPTETKKETKAMDAFGEIMDQKYADQTKTGKWNVLYVLFDIHPYIKTPDIWGKAKDFFDAGKSRGVTYVMVSVNFDVPPELEREVTTISLPLPTRDEIGEILDGILVKNANVPRPTNSENLVEAALGLTAFEVENTFALSIVATGQLDVDVIKDAKKQIICNEGILDYRPSKETLDSIGGLKEFIEWAKLRLNAFSPEAQEYGLPYPRGVLLIGIPGCGKSLVAKALANIWQKPLLTLDIGKLFNKYQGETDRNTRLVFEKAEAMAPAVLYIDEIEKAFSGAQGSGETDGGTSMRMFGNFLTWLQEKESPVFVIATANDVSRLPPEFLRKGRFDEIFFVDLPDVEERKEIFEIQFKKYKRDPKNFDIAVLAEATENFTGAEIEEVITSSLFHAYDDNKRDITTKDVIEYISTITPMAVGVMRERVVYLKAWCEERNVRNASNRTPQVSTEATEAGLGYGREIRIPGTNSEEDGE